MYKLLVISLITFSSLASAEGFYLRSNVGVGISPNQLDSFANKKSLDRSILMGIALGYELSPSFALEGDLRYRKLKFHDTWTDDGTSAAASLDANAYTFMANAVYHFDIGKVQPYLKAGAGIAKANGRFEYTETTNGNTNKLSFKSKSDPTLAWSIGTGINYQVSKSLSMSLEYQYLSAGDVNFSKNTKTEGITAESLDYKAHEISAGIRYNF